MLCSNYEGDAYPDYAASVLAGNDLFRSVMASAFPLFAVQMFRNLEKLNGPQAVSAFLGFTQIHIDTHASFPLPGAVFFSAV